MFRVVFLLCLLKLVLGLTELDQWFIKGNPGIRDNSFLLPSRNLDEVYKFAPNVNLPPSATCATINITTVTSDDFIRYIVIHGNNDNTAVIYDRPLEKQKGILTGGNEVKFFAWDPKSIYCGTQFYVSHAFRKINNDYILLYNSCGLWSSKHLWSRSRNKTTTYLLEVISTIKEVKRLERQRFCEE